MHSWINKYRKPIAGLNIVAFTVLVVVIVVDDDERGAKISIKQEMTEENQYE
jgi:hypothetical protein